MAKNFPRAIEVRLLKWEMLICRFTACPLAVWSEIFSQINLVMLVIKAGLCYVHNHP